MTQSTEPVHPGHILFDQAMKPLGVSRNKLARDIDVPVGRISDIVAGKRGITPDTALRLGRYFGTSAEMWIQFQTDYDLHVARCSTWVDIEPRVRELQPVDPDAVAPVTARDQHTERRYYPPDEEEEEEDHTAPTETAATGDYASVMIEIDPEESPHGDTSEDSETKWWSTPIAADDATAPDQETAQAVEIPDPALVTADAEATADAPETLDEPVERTFTLDVKPSTGTAAASEAEPLDDPETDTEPEAVEQVFEIDVSPTAAVSHVVTDGDETTDIVAAEPEPEPAHDEALADGLDEDDYDEDGYSGEIPGDAFADEVDEDDLADEFDEDFDDAFASEEEEEEEEALEPVLARTGTDDLAPLDPPLAAPGLDAGGISMDDLRQAQTSGLSPANWSNALETEPSGEVGFSDTGTDGSDTAESAAAPDPSALYDVPLPSEVEPAMEGALPPRPPAEDDESLASLDIPEPGKARKLFEYDD